MGKEESQLVLLGLGERVLRQLNICAMVSGVETVEKRSRIISRYFPGH